MTFENESLGMKYESVRNFNPFSYQKDHKTTATFHLLAKIQSVRMRGTQISYRINIEIHLTLPIQKW